MDGVGVIAVLFVLVWGKMPREMWFFFLGAWKANSEIVVALKNGQVEALGYVL